MDPNNNNLQQQIIESQEAFIDQFNPDSQNFHHGIPTPVPVGGKRIPDSMPTEFPEQPQQEAEEIDYGPEYKKVVEMKGVLDQLKKNLNKLNQTQEAIMRHNDGFNQQNLTPQQKEKLQKLYESDVSTLQIVIQLIQDQIKVINEFGKFTYVDLPKILIYSQNEYKNKEELFEYSKLIKQITQAIFKDNQKLTEEVKQIKKAYQQKKKEQE